MLSTIMIATRIRCKNMFIVILYFVHTAAQVQSTAQFSSHVSVNTPARSFAYRVGDPVYLQGRRIQNRSPDTYSRSTAALHRPTPNHGPGYPRVTPSIPFTSEEISSRTLSMPPWQYYNYKETIPVLPPSPYKVNSPDPESLWPEGLFIPPSGPPRLAPISNRRSDIVHYDPYLLEGSEAIAAVHRSKKHGQLYFHEIPHIESLLANQELRVKNNLKRHILGSLRHTWLYNRL